MKKGIIIVAGHICLDMIVELDSDASSLESLLIPGKLLEVGPPILSGGGVVANTGLALHRLGVNTRLIGKLGDDLYGQSILQIFQGEDESLTDNMIISSGGYSSYTLVINSSHMDRIFLHHPGTNDTFKANDVPAESLSEASIFHFGYPPLMKKIYSDGGVNLSKLFRRVQDQGIVVSLDMAKPDPNSSAGKIDWKTWMTNVLPNVDIFMPSFDEILYMLDRSKYENILNRIGSKSLISEVDGALLSEISSELLSMGPSIIVIKLGEEGIYMRTTDNFQRLTQLEIKNNKSQLTHWLNKELLKPSFQTTVLGTTGAGDCAIAGFLSGILNQGSPEEILTNAAAVGAYSVEQTAGASGIPSQKAVTKRIKEGWQYQQTKIKLIGWTWDESNKLWIGPGK